MKTLGIAVEVVEERGDAILLKLKNGFGDPTVLVARDKMLDETVEFLKIQKDLLEKEVQEMRKTGEGLSLAQFERIRQALGHNEV